MLTSAKLISFFIPRLSGGRRKVLFVYRFCGLGGVETATLTKVEALNRVGIDAILLFTEFYGDGARSLAQHPLVKMAPLNKQTLRELLDDGVQAISIIDYPEFFELLSDCQIDIPVVFETHSSLPESLVRYYKHFNDSRLRAIIVPSHHNEQLIRQRLDPRCDIIVLRNAVDHQRFRPKRVNLQSVFPGLLESEKLILWIGRLEDEKNPSELATIAEKLLATNSNFRFAVIGDHPGRYEEHVSRLLSKMSVTTRSAFTFVRTVENAKMPEFYNAARETGGALLSTSLHESLPMTFLEAMACKCPVLSTDVGGVRDLIVHERTGLLYRAGASDQATAILRNLVLATNRRAVERLTCRARGEVLRRHSPNKIAKQYQKLVAKVFESSMEKTRNQRAT